ncbi:MAG: rhomboid family intramembrane serine protease [Thermoplasmatota archaeon]
MSWIVLIIIIVGLYYGYKTEMYMTQILMIQNLLIFMIAYFPGFISPNITFQVYNDLAGKAVYITSLQLLFYRFYTFISMMYLHADIMHIGMNMIILFFIGMPLEDRIGKDKFLFVYIFGGFIATLGQYFIDWGDTGLNIGASGAVFAVMGALVFMFPKDKITMFLGPILMRRIRVDLAVAVFIMMQTGYALLSPDTNIAHAAHFAGFAGGMLLGAMLKKIGTGELKEKARDYTKLKILVTDEKSKDIYKKIISSDEEEVKKAWTEYLIDKSKCPRCGRDLNGPRCRCGFKLWED